MCRSFFKNLNNENIIKIRWLLWRSQQTKKLAPLYGRWCTNYLLSCYIEVDKHILAVYLVPYNSCIRHRSSDWCTDDYWVSFCVRRKGGKWRWGICRRRLAARWTGWSSVHSVTTWRSSCELWRTSWRQCSAAMIRRTTRRQASANSCCSASAASHATSPSRWCHTSNNNKWSE